MQELTRISSASIQNTNQTSLGCSANSACQTQINNHESLQQHQHIQTSEKPHSSNQSQTNNSAIYNIAPTPAAFDPISNNFYAILEQASEESKDVSEPITKKFQLLQSLAKSPSESISADTDPSWTFKPLDATSSSYSSVILSNQEFRSKNGSHKNLTTLNCMRFDPKMSSQGLEFSQSNLTVKSKDKLQRAICDTPLTEGIHYWEINCPIRLEGILFGVTTKGENPISFTQNFQSTTERVVGVELNLNTLEIRYFIQSRYFKKQKCKKLVSAENKPLENLEWYPLIEFKESGNEVTLNPFRDHPIPETTSTQALSKLPERLCFDITHSQIAMLEQTIGNTILINCSYESSQAFLTELQSIQNLPNFKVTQQITTESDSKKSTYVLIQFQSWADLITFTKSVKGELAHTIYGPRTISKLLLQIIDSKSSENFNSSTQIKDLTKDKSLITWLETSILSDKQSLIQTLKPQLQEESAKNLLALLQQIKENSVQTENTTVTTLPKVACTQSGKVVIASGSEIKIMSQTADMTLFSNYPTSTTDQVYLNINSQDLKFLVFNCQESVESIYIGNFIAQLIKSFNGQRARLSYFDALLGVQSLLKVCISKYQKAEALGNTIQICDTNKNQTLKKVGKDSNETLSFTELQLLLSIILNLEDQLWSMTQASQVPQEVRNLWPKQLTRNHTAFGRSSSMIHVANSENPLKLAELGLINEGDLTKKFMHFQESSVPIENIYEQNLQTTLEKQLPNNFLLKGLSTWNVKLDSTLNSLPPSIHLNGLPSSQYTKSAIEAKSSIDEVHCIGNFVLTGNKENSSVNLFSTQLGLNRTLQHNFSRQKYQELKEGKTKALSHLKFKKIFEDPIVSILSKIGEQIAVPVEPLFKESDLKQQIPILPDSNIPEDEFFGGLFEISNSAIDQVKKVKAEYDSDSSEDLNDTEIDHKQHMTFIEAFMTTTQLKKTDQNSATQKAPDSTTAPTVVQSEEAKAKEAAEKTKNVLLQVKLKKELMVMSFTSSQIDAAMLKAKKFSIDELVDLIITAQAEEAKNPTSVEKKKQEPEELITWNKYQCEQCTFINEEQPSQVCSMCGSPAPESAKVIKISDQQKEQNQKLIKEEEEQKKAKEREEKAQIEALKKQELLKKLHQECLNYYESTKVLTYFGASHMNGASKKPVLFGCALQGKGWVDLHFKWARYSNFYINNFFENEEKFSKELQMYQTSVESIIPSVLLKRNQEEIMKTSHLAVSRVQLDSTSCVFQIGQNVSKSENLKIIVCGKKDGRNIVIAFTIDHNGLITSQHLAKLEEFEILNGVSDGKDALLIQTSDKIFLFNITLNDKTIQLNEGKSIDISSNEKLIGVSNGVANLLSGKQLRLIDISQRVEEQEKQKQNAQSLLIIQQSNKLQEGESVLNLTIDPQKITVDDLDRYERLMLGDGSIGVSNSTGFEKQAKKHIWQSWEDTEIVGPLDIKLTQPTSLISLNIDVQFKCNTIAEIIQQVQSQEGSKPIKIAELSQKQNQIQGNNNLETAISTISNQKRLGLFTMKAFAHEEQNTKTESSETPFLPLIVKRNKGSCYNIHLLPSKMLIDNDLMFASNYAKPEIVFAHASDQRILIDKVTIRTLHSSKTGAYPLGEGMIFLSDTLQPFEQIDAFTKFTQQDYNAWKQERVKDLRPLRSNEPVAYFVFDENLQITFELDFKRSAKYILLIPTGFRQKPQAFLQNVDQVPMEIQFFGVSGTVVSSDDSVLDVVEVNDTNQNLNLQINSGFDLEVEIRNRDDSFKFTISDIKIDQILACGKSISSETFLQNQSAITQNLKFEGQSLIRITDSRLSLQSIDRVLVKLKAKDQSGQKRAWDVLFTSIECIKAKVSTQNNQSEQPLFSNNQLSVCHYRSCLLDPLYFNVVNKQILSLISDNQVSKRLRTRAIKFLTHIVHKDNRIAALVLKEINILNFLNANVFGFDQNLMIPVAQELLQSFQSDQTFLNNLYQILIDKVEKLSDETISFHGYEALIGMIKWALPLNIENTLDVLVQTLVKKILTKIASCQKKDQILFRTRFLKDSNSKCAYPFDSFSFQAVSNQTQNQGNSSTDKKQVQYQKRDDLIQDCVFGFVADKTSCIQKHKIRYFAEVELNLLKFYFSNPKTQGGSYSFSIEITDGSKVVKSMHYPLHVFHQFVVVPYDSKADKNSDHALTITGLNGLKTQKLKITITFKNLNTVNDLKLNEAQLPTILIESYGKISDSIKQEQNFNYEKIFKSVTADHKKSPYTIGKSYQVFHITEKSSKGKRFLPVKTQSNQTKPQVLFEEEDKQSIIQNENSNKTEENFVQNKVELQKLQKGLSEQINGEILPKSELISLVSKIGQLQNVVNSAQQKPEESMQYLIQVACDISKLIQFIKELQIDLKPYFLKFCPSLPDFCLDFFTQLIVNEGAKVHRESLEFFKQCLFDLLSQNEKNNLICKIIEIFLTKPITYVSQKKIIQAVGDLEVCDSILISYMVEKLGIEQVKIHEQNPLMMMLSVLTLADEIYQELKPTPIVVNEKELQVQQIENTMNHDQQFKNQFYTMLWISKNSQKLFTKQEQIALIGIVSQGLCDLSKVISLDLLVKLNEDFEATQTLAVDFICYQNKMLQDLRQKSFTQILTRFESETIKLAGDVKTDAQLKAAKDLLKIMNSNNQHEQTIMTWLIDFKIQNDQAGSSNDQKIENEHQQRLINLFEKDQSLWLGEVNRSIDNYLQTKKTIDQIEAYIADPQLQDNSQTNNSLFPVIKKLISMLQKSKSCSVDSLQQIWTLSLRSLRAVEVKKLIESQVLEDMIDAFLNSSDKIQQVTFTQILKISESIAANDKNGRFLCKLLFKTLNATKNNRNASDDVVIAVCQGWLDILTIGHVSANTKSDKAETRLDDHSIYSTLEAEDILQMLQQASDYASRYLNLGTFEGASGAHNVIIMRLQIISDMFLICKRALSQSKRSALFELFSECQKQQDYRQIISTTFDKLISWLFLSGRTEEEEKELIPLGSTSNTTPATALAKQITQQLTQILELISDCNENTEVIQLALQSVTTVVRSINQQVIQRSVQDKLSFFVGIKLTKRSCQLFTKLVSHWLVNDTVVHYFVFTLKGFDFLLDTISYEYKSQNQTSKSEGENKNSNKNALWGSDLGKIFLNDYISDSLEGFLEEGNKNIIDTNLPKNLLNEAESSNDDNFVAPICELAKTKFILQEQSSSEPVQSYATVDWPVNKKAYKHKVYSKNLKDSRGYLEHEMLFKLNQNSLIREIQIGFVNYWASESEVCIEPLTVLVQGGMDKDNLQHICALDVITDTAFLSVNSTIFAKNLQEYDNQNDIDNELTVEDLIKNKIQSIANFKCQWLKFSMRRNVLTCIENSPLAARLQKPQQLSINFISLAGYDLTLVKSNSSNFIVKEQKKAALKVISQICSGEFSRVLKVIANQPDTINKIKNQFDLLSSLVDDKSSMIEPTFVSIATHNSEMGDWIIKRFITTQGFEKHASLCGKIIICDKEKVVDRLQLLLVKILEILNQIMTVTSGQASLALRISAFIDIYIKTVHLVAPELPQDIYIDLNVNSDVIMNGLIEHISQVHEPGYQFKLLHFLALILSPPLPFVNKAIDQIEFTKLLLSSEGQNDQLQQQKFQIASIIAAQNSKIALNILNNIQGQLKELLSWNDPQKINTKIACHWAKFWINTIADQKVKARLQDEDLPLKLYDLIKETDQTGIEVRIIKEFQEEYLILIVELILRISAGHPQLEKQLTSTVIKDLDTLRTKRDMFFINKVLLPLIRNEQTVPICIIDRNLSSSWNLNMDSLSITGGEIKVDKQDHQKFVPSDLIESEVRVNLIKAFKEIVGKVSNASANNSLTCQWQLMKTITQEQQIGEFPDLWRSIQNKGPMMMLIKGKNSDGLKYLFGGFCSKQMPQAPENFDTDQDHPVTSSPEDFLFVHIQNEGMFFFKPNNDIILEFFSDYESGGAISMGSDFLQVSMSYDFRLQVGQTNQLTEVMVNAVPRQKLGPIEGLKHFSGLLNGDQNKAFNVERAEIWIGNNGAKTNSINFPEKPKGFVQKIITQIQMPLQNVSDSMNHPWLSSVSPQNFFRSRRVFNVPAHLSVQKVAEILLYLNQEQNTFSLTNKEVKFKMNDTIQTVYDQFMLDKQVSEKHQNILDLNFFTENLNSDILIDEEPLDVVSFVQSSYLPKNGFFDQFESQGGVKQFIAVTLASLTWWKDQTIAESWRLWLKEIDSFSEIPLFFQIFLKNKACKELLFKVLSGEPDKDVDARKWETEQKDAVQVNYKILAEIFAISNDVNIRQTAIKAGFLERILERLGSISGEKARVQEISESEEEELPTEQLALAKTNSIDNKDKVRQKRAGVGYSSKQGETFNVTAYLENKKLRNEQIKILVDICCNFFTSNEWQADKEVLDIILESPLLPLLESAFRNGSWLDMAKEASVYHSYMALTRSLATQSNLIGCLIEIDKKYKPVQTEPIYKLLSKLNDLASIFLQCLNQQQSTSEGTKRDRNQKIQSNQRSESIEYFEPPKFLKKKSTMFLENPFLTIQDDGQDSFYHLNKQFENKKQPDWHLLSNQKINQPTGFGISEDLGLPKPLLSFNDWQNQEIKPPQAEKLQQQQDIKSQQNPINQWVQEMFTFPQNANKVSQQDEKSTPFPPSLTSQIDLLTNSYMNQPDPGSFNIQQDLKWEWPQPKVPTSNPKETKTENNATVMQLNQDSGNDDDWEDMASSYNEEDEDSENNNKNNQEDSDSDDSQPHLNQPTQNWYKEDESENEPDLGVKLAPTLIVAPQKIIGSYKMKSDDSSSDEEENLSSKMSHSDDFSSASSDISLKFMQKSHQTKTQPTQVIQKTIKLNNINQLPKTMTELFQQSANFFQTINDQTDPHQDELISILKNAHISKKQIKHTQKQTNLIQPIQMHFQSNISSLNPLSQHNFQFRNNGENPEKLARDVTRTQQAVQNAIEKLLRDKQGDNFIEDALQLPIQPQYRALLSSLRFDYMDMKQGEADFKHHYKSTAAQNQSPSQAKMVRIAQELADISNALPAEHTNSIFVRVDKSRVDMIKSLITGASGTPYAHGCYEFDLFLENTYPNGPPKMNLMTTGAGQIRFNPNLYACGKVCLSLLGTWRGNATENWDPKISTILQVLLSVQAIIMSEEVYFNEPGFENEAGTPDGEKRNEGYMNIVRYGNVKYAMLGQIKKPSKGFETVILRHFYIKKAEILTDVYKWVERADKVEALFTGLVSDHNHNIAKDFQKSKTKYREMLQAAVKELEDELHKLDKPTNYQIKPKAIAGQKQKKEKDVGIADGKQNLDEVDMNSDDEKENTMIDTTSQNIDVNDEAVKDRWSRYFAVMGVEAVAKQAAAHIFLSGVGPVGIEIAKNLVLAGCKSMTLHDTKIASQIDLSAQFFLSQADVGKPRVEACLHRLQQLNFYVRCKAADNLAIPLTESELSAAPWNLKQYNVVILTEASYETIIAVNNFCHKHGIKFITTDVHGVFGRVFNDFGNEFECLDKDGEELQDSLIKNINIGEKTVIELHAKHKFAEGEDFILIGIDGMKLIEGQNQSEENKKVTSGSINDTIWKVTSYTTHSITIGDTRMYQPYEGNGTAKQLKKITKLQFKSFEESMQIGKDTPFDGSLAIADFEKLSHGELSQLAFATLDVFTQKHNGQKPQPWSVKDALEFIELSKQLKQTQLEDQKLLLQFVFTSQGVLNPLCAFFGGFVAQEAIKAITGKFMPINQVFYYDAVEVLPKFELKDDTLTNPQNFNEFVQKLRVEPTKSRSDGLRICVGQEVIDKLAYTKLFMVGAGAIGCELLKNYAMLGVGTGQKTNEKAAGQLVLTDPDIIEVSNLNRQFLFREKHLRKPKSQTAAAAAIYMNPDLKGNIIARLDKVHEGTNHIYTNKFFEELTIVTNALDNVQARKYIDSRCVSAKTALLESGTLGPKGHVQVILPYQTETYGQQEDPEETNEIPFCTMKMFPEETLHCVEWARDKFGRMFTQMPQSAIKILEEGDKFQAISQQDLIALKEGVRLLKKRPKTFIDCVEYARMRFEKLFSHDIQQLLHVYPLDSKTKDGQLFWTKPKRPPTPIVFDKKNPLHRMFVSSLACLRAKIFFIEIPNKNPRSDEFRDEVAENADFFKPKPFVPNESKAKEIQDSVNKAAKTEEEEKKEETQASQETETVDQTQQMLDDFKNIQKSLKLDKSKSVEETIIRAEVFEKDNDSNFHIDFMYSMANCRSQNYKLDEMDWLTVKLKAGRIVPALATTTAAIAGLQSLELIKAVMGIDRTDFRNTFLNLAVPSMQAGEPITVLKEKLLEGLEVSIWDRWEVKEFKNGTLQQFMTKIEELYKGLEVRDVLRGNSPIYFHAIMQAESKQQEKKNTLESILRTLTETESEAYVDLTITCVRKDDQDQKIVNGVPQVRVWF